MALTPARGNEKKFLLSIQPMARRFRLMVFIILMIQRGNNGSADFYANFETQSCFFKNKKCGLSPILRRVGFAVAPHTLQFFWFAGCQYDVVSRKKLQGLYIIKDL